ncbi:hypothetical protein DXG01_006599 [Tephrocybe rancida]|nr:hypothetical protein DXG01_006599 [Tephrocybe rancida]
MLLVYSVLLYVISVCSAISGLTKRNSTGLTDAVAWDSHSLFIQGQRVFILSAEIHPWRLPGNPDLWADILQKVKSNGFNTVSFYINWAVHYPTPSTNNGKGDFQEGTYRDIQRFIDEAKKAGLWLIARCAEGSLKLMAKRRAVAFLVGLAISQVAFVRITQAIMKAENEFSASAANNIYMQAIIDLYRANGVVVPITHNDQHAGQAGNFSPDRPGTHVDIYCGDSYPQGANRWAQVQAIYYSAHVANAPNNPLCLAEFGGGFLLGWGAAAPGGTGYEKYSNDLTDASYVGLLETIHGSGLYIDPSSVLFGGTNWGQTVEPTVYSSYDYGGGINENRVATPKMNEMRLQGLFLRVSRDLLGATLIANGTNYTSSNSIHTAELRNLDNGAAFYIIRQNASTSTAVTTTLLTVDTSVGPIVIPKSGNITFNGRESKILVTDYIFGTTATHILYSTAEIDATDYIILYGPVGQTGETAFLFGNGPTVSGPPTVLSNFANGILTLSYSLMRGSQFITIKNGAKTIVVTVLDKSTANTWHAPVIAGEGNFGEFFSIGTNQSVLVSGPYLVRTAKISGSTLALTGDLNGTTSVEFLAPSNVQALTWNGVPAPVAKSSHGSFSASLRPQQSGVSLPVLSDWKVSGSLPEIDPAFDDSSFITADLTTTNGGAAKPPDTFRGYLNEGGLYAERIGAHLPGFPDSSWATGTPLAGVSGAGINFYRTTFDLNIPDGVDIPIRLSITPSATASNFRVQIYLNGWQVGKYTNNIGPQTLFVLPAGILRRKSVNTLALSLWSLDAGGASIADLQIVSDGTFSTSLPLEDYASPDYEDQKHLRPVAEFVKPM